MNPLIITCAVQGAEATKEQNPNLPITLEEVVAAAVEAEQAGAAILHLHVRDEQGRPTQAKEVFQRHIEALSRKTRLIIQVSTGGAVGMSMEERAQPLELAPEMATLTTGTVNFGQEVFYNPPAYIEHFARLMQAYGVKPEIEVFETGMIANALRLVKAGLLTLPLHFDFVLGVPGGMPATAENLLHLVHSLPPGSTWSVAGIGRHQLPMAVLAMVMGGHVRVGLEDNLYYSRGRLAQSNAELIARVVRIARELGRPIATPDEAREILGLSLAKFSGSTRWSGSRKL